MYSVYPQKLNSPAVPKALLSSEATFEVKVSRSYVIKRD